MKKLVKVAIQSGAEVSIFTGAEGVVGLGNKVAI